MKRYLAALPLMLAGLLTACAGTTAVPSAAETPPSIASLSGNGAYTVGSYTDLPDAPEYGDATIYYPRNHPGRIGGVAIAPGFTERQSHIEWWGPRLASHGFAVLVLDTNDPRDNPELRAAALIAAVRTLRAENTRTGSPLAGKLDVDRMAIMGHSMGGGGALIAANQLGRDIRAVIPFTPWQPNGDFGRITAPTLVIAGAADRVAAVAEHAWPHFQSLPATTPRAYMEITEGDHFIADTNRGTDLATIGRYGVAWLKLYVDGDERYRGFLYGEEQRVDGAKFSRYVTAP